MGVFHRQTSIQTPPPSRETLAAQMEALASAQADADALNVDHEYRLTLLELGLGGEV